MAAYRSLAYEMLHGTDMPVVMCKRHGAVVPNKSGLCDRCHKETSKGKEAALKTLNEFNNNGAG